jgi:hypothetical protein
MIYIDLLNQSTEASDQTLKWLTAALQIQINRDFAPIWGYNAVLTYVPKGQVANPAHWQLVFFDTADIAGALGYHELTSTGLPLGKIFIRTTEQAGMSWSVTASHELIEMLGDPYANTTVLVLDNTGVAGIAYAYELCDACEDDSLGYAINDFKVSDFVTPEWFEPAGTSPATAFDFKGHVKAPFQLLAGGYIGVFAIPNTAGWTQKLAEKAPTPHTPVEASRRLSLRQFPQQLRRRSRI